MGAASLQDPVADRDDQPRFLGERDELIRRNEPVFGVMPADQRLDTDDAAARDADLRLEVKLELRAILERQAQIVFQRDALDVRGVHRRLELQETVFSLRLGLVHGDVGVADQDVRCLAVLGINGNADTRRRDEVACAHRERPSQLAHDLLGDDENVVRRVDVGEQHSELVAALARQRVAGTQATTDALGEFLQQDVAFLMAVGVVDQLEAIDVEEHDADALVPALGLRHRQLQTVSEKRAVG